MLVSVDKTVTDHLIFRGYYYALTICIYGEIKEDVNLAIECPFYGTIMSINHLE